MQDSLLSISLSFFLIWKKTVATNGNECFDFKFFIFVFGWWERSLSCHSNPSRWSQRLKCERCNYIKISGKPSKWRTSSFNHRLGTIHLVWHKRYTPNEKKTCKIYSYTKSKLKFLCSKRISLIWNKLQSFKISLTS